jgi:iron complex transport system ATP-binding protein
VSAALELHSLTVELGGRPVVSDLSLRVEHGEWVGLIGPNGAGKTSALRAVSGLIAYSGSLSVDGGEVSGLSRRAVARRVALVPQAPSLPVALTVSDYVLLGRTPHISYLGRESAGDLTAAGRAIDRLELVELADRPLVSLSGGERQRAVLARALAQEAPLLLLDEPTTALDIGRQQSVLELVDCLRHELGLTVVAAMHDLTLAGQFADRLVLLSGGLPAAEGTPAAVLTEWAIAEHYRARVDVLDGATPAVVPRRAAAPSETPWRD